MTYVIEKTLVNVLNWVDTPTVCSAIEIAQGNSCIAFTDEQVMCSNATRLPLVGFARTAKISTNHAGEISPEAARQKQMSYYRYISACRNPSIAVIEDQDGHTGVGAFWGQLNAELHKGFGIAGVLTNGTMCDFEDIPEDFPILARALSPSANRVHVTDFDTTVSVLGLTVKPDDMIHADRHGAVIIPQTVVPVIGEAIAKLLEAKNTILDIARQPEFDFEKFEQAWIAFDATRS